MHEVLVEKHFSKHAVALQYFCWCF